MSGFRGTIQGSVQTDYTDHPSRGFPGQIATQGDPSLVDGYPVGGTTNLMVGLGVMRGTSITIPVGEYGDRPAPFPIIAPSAGENINDFVGILVRDSAQENDIDGNPIWSPNKMAPVLRQGRIFVTATIAVSAGNSVHMYIDDTTGHGFPIGAFTNAAAGVDTIQITSARWYDTSAANSIAIIEIGY